ncbi:MAG: lipopolysaccharide biosynthesis protein [Rikenellaceae bacterium]
MTAHPRIFKNTLLLYSRTLLLVAISLYTSRIVLEALGEVDYGIYNIVGGVVVLFAFLNTAMTSATQRFLNFELSLGNSDSIAKVFSTSLSAHILIAIIFIILSESFGYFYLFGKLNIPLERLESAKWVYHISIATTCLNILRVPYSALIIAHQRMSFYAYAGVAEGILKLAFVFLLILMGFDKLILYALFTLLSTGIITLIYKAYCRRKYVESIFNKKLDTTRLRQLLSFSGWSMIGSISSLVVSWGANFLVNIFFGVIFNAAMAIATQIQSTLWMFVSNFQTAFNPALVNDYATGSTKAFFSLIILTSKITFFLLFTLSLPLYITMNEITAIWLTEVPAYTVSFARLSLILGIVTALSGPLWISAQAIGEIRNYQIIVSIILILNLPIMYLVLEAGFSADWIIVSKICINFLALIFRLLYLKIKIKFPISRYLKNVFIPSIVILVLCTPLPLYFHRVFEFTSPISTVVWTTSLCVAITIPLSLLIGFNASQRKLMLKYITKGFTKKRELS